MMSMRADFLGRLQNDTPLFKARYHIDVPPLGEEELREVVSCPARLLGARFETERLIEIITRRTAEDSVKDVGALPLLSYTLDDIWAKMVRQGDGILRLPAESFELGGVLVDRANTFLASHPRAETTLRRILTLRCATVREDGEPTRRRAPRSEFTDEEWRLVSELADYPNRLLATVTPDGGETHAEVAHEAIFRRWDKLRDWIAAEKSFLAWRSGLEFARREWQATPPRSRRDALLRGFALKQARGWLAKRPEAISRLEREFVVRSRQKALWRILRTQAAVGIFLVGLAAWWQWPWVKERAYSLVYVDPLPAAREHALASFKDFTECADCPKMVVVPAGSVTIGSTDSPDEGPPHPITIEHPFAVSVYPVKFDQWDACVAHGDCAANISEGGWGRGRQPVINVSWKDAKQYVAWLSRITGKTYRLLTEAEWEYAARASPAPGRSTYFYFGNDDAELPDYAWFATNAEGQPHEVGQKKPNKFGLYDMLGNVAQWVEDCYRDAYRDPLGGDGSAWTGGNCNQRVIRGGSWVQRARMLRSSARNSWNFDKGSNNIGIRVGRTLAP
jgi:formylglycine-generating enzyme required for sulfatase activity